MTDSELLKATSEENRTRLILDIMKECQANGKDLADAIKEIEKLLAG